MGNAVSSAQVEAPPNPNRTLFVEYKTFAHPPRQSTVVVYEIEIAYLRHRWRIYKRFSEFRKLDLALAKKYPSEMASHERFGSQERGTLFGGKSDGFLHNRGKAASVYLQMVCDNAKLFASSEILDFITLSEGTLKADYGRKGPEGILQVSTGGFYAKYSTSMFSNAWSTVWVAMRDTQILMFSGRHEPKLVGTLLIDQGMEITCSGVHITIKTNTRKLMAQANTDREANEWVQAANAFYTLAARNKPHPFGSSYPVRFQTDVRTYETSAKMYQNAAISILKAVESIFICANELYPNLIMTRPPLPTVRLDQILKFKADQGVKIYVILYKEADATNRYKSEDAKHALMSLNSSIEVLRHSNASKPQWIHNENLIVVDRNIAYVCGGGLSAGSWDDERHLLVDEDGVRFPGPDYSQPCPFLHKPVRTEDQGYFESDPMNIPAPTTPSDAMLDDASVRDTSLTAGSMGTNASVGKMPEKSFSQRVKGILAKALGADKPIERRAELRMKLPRRPVHSLHVAVSGLAARDLSAHFVQRWNHHRLSKAEHDRSVLADVTDITNAAMCARCRRDQLGEFTTQCPSCYYQVGPIASFLKSSSPSVLDHKLPDLPSDITYIEFRCEFTGPSIGLVLEGTGPTIVSHVTIAGGSGSFPDGILVSSHGPLIAELMASYPLKPHAGDVVVTVNDEVVTHIGSDDVGRYIRRKKGFAQSNEAMPERVVVLFRRHYVEELHTLPTATRQSMGQALSLTEDVVIGTPMNYSEVPISHRNSWTQQAPAQANASTAPQYGVNVPGQIISVQQRPSAPSQVVNYPVVVAPTPIYDPQPQAAQPVYAQSYGEYGRANAIMFGQAAPVSSAAHSNIPMANAVPVHSPPPPVKPDVVLPAPALPSVAAPVSCATEPETRSETDSRAPLQPEQVVIVEQPSERPHVLPSLPLAMNEPSAIGSQEATVEATHENTLPTAPQHEHIESSSAPADSINIQFPEVPTIAPLPPVPTGEIRVRQAAEMDDSLPTGDRVHERRAVAMSGRKHESSTQSLAEGPKMDSYLGLGEREVEEAVTSTSGRGQPVYSAAGYNNNPGNAPYAGQPYQPTIYSQPDITYGSTTTASAFYAPTSPTQGVATTPASSYGYPQLPQSQPQPIYPAPGSYAPPQAQPSYQMNSPSFYQVQPGASFGSTSSLSAYGHGPAPAMTSAYQSAVAPKVQQAVPVPADAPLSPTQQVDKQARLEKGKKRAIQLEIQLAIGRLVHEHKFSNSLISSLTGSGTCHVQVLRSSALWSVGGATESSIAKAWVESIKQAQKFIYIESEYLISDPTGTGVKNAIAKVLLDRVVDAALRREVFRVIVVLPFTVPGDFLKDERARRAMQAQYQTICRSASSIMVAFAARVAGINPSDYISFFSLRQWGVMNNRVVSDQLTIDSNVLIVDDRVAIIGSASISDRGMRGDRNSEVAVRIEDATLMEVPYDGAKFVVGFTPWALRTDLMKAHIGDESIDISDPICASTYYGSLRGLAGHNCTLFDELDGPASPYRCASASAFETGRETAAPRSCFDPMVQELTSRIQGRLVFLPLDFLSQP